MHGTRVVSSLWSHGVRPVVRVNNGSGNPNAKRINRNSNTGDFARVGLSATTCSKSRFSTIPGFRESDQGEAARTPRGHAWRLNKLGFAWWNNRVRPENNPRVLHSYSRVLVPKSTTISDIPGLWASEEFFSLTTPRSPCYNREHVLLYWHSKRPTRRRVRAKRCRKPCRRCTRYSISVWLASGACEIRKKNEVCTDLKVQSWHARNALGGNAFLETVRCIHY